MKTFRLYLFIIIIISFTVISQSQNYIEQNSGVTVNLTSVSMYQTNWLVGYQVWVCGFNGTVLRTSNGGANWLNAGGNGIPANVDLVNIWCIDSINILTAGNIGTTTYVYRTSNKGVSWSQVFSQSNGKVNGIFMRTNLLGFLEGNPVGGRWSLWKTSNGGINWDSTGLYLPQAGSETGWNNSLCLRNNRIWFGTNNSRIYFSSNYGANWQIQSTAPEINSTAILFYWQDSAYGYFGGSNSYKTTNYGNNWTLLTCPGSGNFVGFTNGIIGVENIYPSTYDFSVRSDSSINYNFGMSNWNRSYSAPSGIYRHIAPFTQSTAQYNYSWAVRSNGGITRVMTFLVGVKKISSEIPQQFSLSQNYPNPFNSSTKFKIKTPKLSSVKVTIFDILGREIGNPVNEMLKPGVYEIGVDGTNYSSGVYFYRMTADGVIVDTKKLVITK